MNKQKRCKLRGSPPTLRVRNEENILTEMQTKASCRLLGAKHRTRSHMESPSNNRRETTSASHQEAAGNVDIPM